MDSSFNVEIVVYQLDLRRELEHTRKKISQAVRTKEWLQMSLEGSAGKNKPLRCVDV